MFNPDPEHFSIKEGVYCGRECFLITPAHSDKGWTKDNLHYRSLIVDKNDDIISSGFPKFFNYSQAPELYPCPTKFKDWIISEKEDGSLLCLDFVNGQVGMRTRGALGYDFQKNSREFEKIFELYPRAKEAIEFNQSYTFLFEMLSVENQIVIKHDKTDFIFIGAIHKETLRNVAAQQLDVWAATYEFKRPKTYNFSSISEAIEAVKYWKGQEGVVIEYNGGQNRVKLKSDHYNLLHVFFCGVKSIDNMIELFFKAGKPENSIDFWGYIKDTIDFEVAEHCAADIQKICAAYQKVLRKQEEVAHFIESISHNFSRKEQAHLIGQNYSDWRKSFCFNLLDNRPLEDRLLAKILKENVN